MSPTVSKSTPPPMTEHRLVGLSIASGVAIGPAYLLTRDSFVPPRRSLEPDEIPSEQTRFSVAVAKAIAELDAATTHTVDLPAAARDEILLLLEAHKAMLEGSRLIRGVEGRIKRSRINAEAALEIEIETIAKSFANISDSYLAARIDDVRGLGTRLLSLLLNRPMRSPSNIPKGSILITDELAPSDTAQLDPKLVKGLATIGGGAEGHAAIMARALGLPSVMALPEEMLSYAQDGTQVVIDGRKGMIIIAPNDETLFEYKAIVEKITQRRQEMRKLRHQKSVTLDGTPIRLMANLEMLMEVAPALDAGAEGVGLLRTEFMFMRRADLPDEDEQYNHLREIIEAMKGYPVTIRTLDIGGDKIAESLSHLYGYEANPALGLRAIRLSLQEPELLETQFAAILRAAAHGPVKIMLPLVTQVAEVERARRTLKIVARRLRRRKVNIPDELPPVGIMVEVPAAALIADDLAKVSDFFSLGTNDLTQYTLAVDRANEHVAPLYDALHPAVLRLIKMTIDAGIRHSIPVSICGEMAGDARVTNMLINLGVRELSMSHPMLPIVKQQVRQSQIVS